MRLSDFVLCKFMKDKLKLREINSKRKNTRRDACRKRYDRRFNIMRRQARQRVRNVYYYVFGDSVSFDKLKKANLDEIYFSLLVVKNDKERFLKRLNEIVRAINAS